MNAGSETGYKQDTFLCASASGDQAYLLWLRDRMIHQYGESPNVDFVQTTNSFRGYFNRRRQVPRWLNWLLRKYDL